MGRFLKILFLACGVSTLLWGCSPKKSYMQSHLVTQVDISCQHKDVKFSRHYTDEQKMSYVLLYLRLLKPLGTPETDPQAIDGDECRITVQLSDGRQKIYTQKAHRYFSGTAQLWQRIDPAQAAGLYRLIQVLPADTL